MKSPGAAIAVLAAVLLVGGWLLFGAQGVPPGPSSTPRSRLPPRVSRAQPAHPGSPSTAAPRNIFEFAHAGEDVARVQGPPRARPSIVAAPAPPEVDVSPEPEAPVRLVGVVLRGGKRKAALAIRGELVVIGPGETADGYTVVAIDEEQGVRLKGPEGEITLTPPEGSPGA